MSVRNDDSYEVRKLREDNEAKAKELGKLESRVISSESSHKEAMKELKQSVNSLNTKLEEAKNTAETKVIQETRAHVEQKEPG